MTRYTIPDEPAAPYLWVTTEEHGVQRYSRAFESPRGPWSTDGGDQRLYWHELLRLGDVSDVHPDLPADAPLPWTWCGEVDDEYAVDAAGDQVQLWDYGPLIVEAMNAYAERITRGTHDVEVAPAGLSPALAYALRELVELWEKPSTRHGAPAALADVLSKVADQYREQAVRVRRLGRVGA